MGFLATSKARSARSLASAYTPASRHRISTRSGCSCGSCESSWNAAAGRRSSLSKRSPGQAGRPERDRLLSGPAASLVAERSFFLVSTEMGPRTFRRETVYFRGIVSPVALMCRNSGVTVRVIFHTVAAQVFRLLKASAIQQWRGADAPVPAGVVPRYADRDVSQWVVHRCFKLLVLLTFPSREPRLPPRPPPAAPRPCRLG